MNIKLAGKLYTVFISATLLFTTSCTSNTTVETGEKDTVAIPETGTNSKQEVKDSNRSQELKPEATVSSAWLLIAGQSAGLTRLNENAEQVYQRLGKPDGGDAAMQKAVAIWYTGHDSTNHSVAIYTAREPGVDPVARIRQIRITSPTFKTAAGVGPGSNLAEIRSAFDVKKTEQYNDEGTTYTVYDSPKGIAFETNPTGQCVAVVIHEAGTTGQGTYLKFRTTNKFINLKKT